MHRSTWKRVERAVARLLSGRRVPVSGRVGSDVVTPLFGVEVKARGSVPAWLGAWLDQARDGCPAGRVPLLVIHTKGDRYRDALAVLRLGDLVDLVSGGIEET